MSENTVPTIDYSTITNETLKEIEAELKNKDNLYNSIITAEKLALFLNNYDSLKNAQAAIDAAEIQLKNEENQIELSKMITDLNIELYSRDYPLLPLPPNPLQEELDQRMGNPGGGKKSKKYRKSRKGKKYRKSRKTTKRGKKRGSKKSRRR